METIIIKKNDSKNLKKEPVVDKELLADLIQGFEDIKAGRVRRVR